MADGDPILIGQTNSGTSITFLQQSPVYLTGGSQLVVVSSPQGSYGVIAESDSADGVLSGSVNGAGVTGFSQNGTGVHGYSFDPNAFGVIGDGSGWGGYFNGMIVDGLVQDNGDLVCQGTTDLNDTNVTGHLLVVGLFVVAGLKAAAVPHPDGTHRALYCLESPESWFEDFGRAKIVSGKANVELDPTFAAVVRTDDYHVFLSPEGDSKGLYVSSRTPAGFQVREQTNGTSTLPFSYRVVARRKDVSAARFEKVELPKARKTPPYSKDKIPKPPKRPNLPGIKWPLLWVAHPAVFWRGGAFLNT